MSQPLLESAGQENPEPVHREAAPLRASGPAPGAAAAGKPRFLRLGIRQKAVLILLATLLAAFTLSGSLVLQSQKQDILRETRHRGGELTHFIAKSLTNSVVGYDYHAIELVLEEAIKHEDIVFARVLSHKGNVMAEKGEPGDSARDVVLFQEDITLGNDRVGRIILGLSTKRIVRTLEEQKWSLIRRELVIILSILLIGFAATTYIVIRPITRISQAMNELQGEEVDSGGGNLDGEPAGSPPPEDPPMSFRQLPVDSRDEIGDLARNFNGMRGRITQAINSLHRSEQRNRAMIDAIPDMMFRINRYGVFLDCKIPRAPGALEPPPCLIGRHVHEMLSPEVSQAMLRHLHLALDGGEAQLFYYTQESEGENRSFEARVSVSGEDETLVIVRDITAQRSMERQIDHLEHYDGLTQLPNRLLFKDRLRGALEAARPRGENLAVLILDLDRFKLINDTLGHDAGDVLLQGVAERLQRCLRSNDFISRPAAVDGSNIISRAGGDEYTILLTQIGNMADVAQAANRVLDSLAPPFRLNGQEISVSASIGVAVSPGNGDDVETLIKNADAAMHHAKDQGRNRYHFHTQDMNVALSRRLAMESCLRKAIGDKELYLHYQPQIEVGSGRLVGVEALLRWKHPELGAVSPAEFIPLAEDSGLILPISAWVLHEACRQNREWQKQGLPPFRVAVNLSGVSFRQPGLVGLVHEALRTSGMHPQYLELELTEGVLLRNDEEVIRTLREIKALGVHLSIDDFGTGYSSLSYLKRFPLDTLKIDRSFVRDVNENPDDAAIASAIIAMAHSLKFQVVAEGVETQAQLDFMTARGCDLIQGYFFSPPVAADRIAALAVQPPMARQKCA